jgi:translation initiation factor 2B subunit (eIF-2B alpha/beta/delta family)
MTHSLSSSIRHFFSLLAPVEVKVIVTESRPLNEGYLLAEFLSSLQIDTVLITDAQMGIWCKSATKIVMGADAVLRDGSVVNKSGTLLMALAAQEFQIPFFVCCDSYKYTHQAAEDFHLEEMQALELGFDTINHVDIRNTYFDITPARLIRGWVTESGLKSEW